jgi:hypothetical protein
MNKGHWLNLGKTCKTLMNSCFMNHVYNKSAYKDGWSILRIVIHSVYNR